MNLREEMDIKSLKSMLPFQRLIYMLFALRLKRNKEFIKLELPLKRVVEKQR
jgi:hypothetical protein